MEAKTFDGKPCVKCEETLRYVSNQRCAPCYRQTLKSYYDSPEGKQAKFAAARKYSKTPAGRLAKRKGALKYQYGISLDDYQKFFDDQNGACKICKKQFLKPLHVDHNHVNGKIRGLLCGRCNKAIGLFDDQPEICREAASYLESTC